MTEPEPIRPGGPPAPSVFAPLRRVPFALFTGAILVSSSGGWMFAVGAGWLMADLGASNTMVAAVQTASMLPLVLFSVFAGALGDLLDRRKLLLWTQAGLMANAAAFALLIDAGWAVPWMILLFAALDGVGSVLGRPTMNAIVPQMVPRAELMAAMTLRSVAFNLSRALGPGAAGALAALAGPSAPFWGDALTFLAVIAFLLWWREGERRDDDIPPERIGQAMRAALRFMRHDPDLRATTARTVLFFVPAAALWSLMPLIAKERLDGGALLYGLLLAAAGIGAVAFALAAQRIKARFGASGSFLGAGMGLSGALALLAVATDAWVAGVAAFLGGAAWQVAFALASTSAQYALPRWIGARGMAMFQVGMFGGLAAGSILWGALSDATSIATALWAAAAAGVALNLAGLRFRLDGAERADLSPSDDRPAHHDVRPEGGAADGPVEVRVAYDPGRADGAARAALVAAIRSNREPRLREGAMDWNLYADPESGALVESFTAIDWTDHERQMTRMTVDDDARTRRIQTLLDAHGGARTVRHYLPPDAAAPDDGGD